MAETTSEQLDRLLVERLKLREELKALKRDLKKLLACRTQMSDRWWRMRVAALLGIKLTDEEEYPHE